MTPRIVVTGGAGFIGVNLARTLDSYELVCFDNFSTGHLSDAEAAGYHRIIAGDIRDRSALLAVLEPGDLVVHLAAQPGVPASIDDPRGDAEINVLGSLNVLEAAREKGVSRVIAASSNAPLGSSPPPAREDRAPRPLSPYGAAKLALEAYCSAFSASYGLWTMALRFANVYGPYSYHKGSVVALYFKLLSNGMPLSVRGDGTQSRDYIFVEDLVGGVAAAMFADAPSGQIVQLGTGVETSVNDLIAAFQVTFPRRELVVDQLPALPGEVQRSFTDPSRARELLGWTYETTLADGLERTHRWFRTLDMG